MPFSMNIREDRCIMTRTASNEGEETVLTTITGSGPVQIDVNDITRFDITYEQDGVGPDGRHLSYACSFSAGSRMEGVHRRYHVYLNNSPDPLTWLPNPDDPLLQYLQRVFFGLYPHNPGLGS